MNEQYKSISDENKNEKSFKYKCLICHSIINWVLQILLWLSFVFIFTSFNFIVSKNLSQISCFTCLGLYIIYIINNLCFSTNFKLLFHIKSKSTLENTLRSIISCRPEIYYNIKCFHYERVDANKKNKINGTNAMQDTNKENENVLNINANNLNNNANNVISNYNHSMDILKHLNIIPDIARENSSGAFKISNGNMNPNQISSGSLNQTDAHISIKSEENGALITYIDRHKFDYFSTRDISGPLNIDKLQAENKNLIFLELSLNSEIYFADSISLYDYLLEKKEYYEKNRWRDVHMNFTIEKVFKHYFPDNKDIFIICENLPWYLNWFVYVLFMLLTLLEFYKIFISKFFGKETYTIRKIISTRKRLNSKKLDVFNPKIVYEDRTHNYNKEDYYKKNKRYFFEKPTQKELEDAKKIDNYFKLCSNDAFEIKLFKKYLESKKIKSLSTLSTWSNDTSDIDTESVIGAKEISNVENQKKDLNSSQIDDDDLA